MKIKSVNCKSDDAFLIEVQPLPLGLFYNDYNDFTMKNSFEGF